MREKQGVGQRESVEEGLINFFYQLRPSQITVRDAPDIHKPAG